MLRRGDHIYVTAPVTVLSYLMKRLGITQKKIRTPCSSGQRRQHGRRSQGLPCFAPDEEHSPHHPQGAPPAPRAARLYGRPRRQRRGLRQRQRLSRHLLRHPRAQLRYHLGGRLFHRYQFLRRRACFNNIGPGFELVGATQNFSIYSDLSKIILSLDMLLGRLEIFPLLLLLSPDTWSRRR